MSMKIRKTIIELCEKIEAADLGNAFAFVFILEVRRILVEAGFEQGVAESCAFSIKAGFAAVENDDEVKRIGQTFGNVLVTMRNELKARNFFNPEGCCLIMAASMQAEF